MPSVACDSQWRALEANPEVISNYASALGGPDKVNFCDVLSVEAWALGMIPKPVHAILFVYPIKEVFETKSKELQKTNKEECEKNAVKKAVLEKLWFTKQTVSNACGTVALLHTFGNMRKSHPLKAGGALEAFYEKSSQLDADGRAAALEKEEKIMGAHAAAGTEGQSVHRDKVQEHFITFINFEGHLVELDGRKSQPVIHDAIPAGSNFLESAVAFIKTNYTEVDPEELRFSMVALTGPPSPCACPH